MNDLIIKFCLKAFQKNAVFADVTVGESKHFLLTNNTNFQQLSKVLRFASVQIASIILQYMRYNQVLGQLCKLKDVIM